jgi:membrane fusion protein, multidrug efflux system
MRWIVGIVIVAALAFGIRQYVVRSVAEKPAAAAASSEATPTVTIATAPVRLERMTRQIEAVGSLRSNEAVIIRPEIAGRITEILFDEGQPARRGTPLFRLDAAIAEAQLQQAKAGLALSRANFERATDLYRRQVGTERARDEATAKLRVDEASVALSQATLDKMTIVAPFDGIVGLRRVSLGDYVNPGQDLVNIENVEQLKVDFRIPEIYSRRLAVGQTVRITLDAIPDATYEGSVYAIDPAHDPNGRAVLLRARLANRDGSLRSGMFARVVLLIEDRQEAIFVPETALVPVGENQFVYRYVDGKALLTKVNIVDGKALLTKVNIGQRRRGQVEIVQGLARDAVIVSEGALKLRDGLPVRAVPAAEG